MMNALRLPLAPAVLLYQSIALALSQIWANKVRGMLTTLGILIGVAAVSAVIALITGLQERVMAEFEAFGTNKLFVSPQFRKKDIHKRAWFEVAFKSADFDEMIAHCPSVKQFARQADYSPMTVSYRTKVEEENVNMRGIDADWQLIEHRGVSFGRPLTAMDIEQMRPVCLINEMTRDKLGLDRDPVGQMIEMNYFGRMLVVGMIEPPTSIIAMENDVRQVIVPFTLPTRKWRSWFDVIATSKSREVTEEAKAEIEFYLRQKRRLKPGEEDDFHVESAQRIADEIKLLARVVKTIATGIVGISLLVGGVGIMNIMLVSVSERTREIGLRKAVGARPSAILLQFLVESVALCLIGGVLGLAAGQGITTIVFKNLPVPTELGGQFKPGRSALPDVQTQENREPSMAMPPLAIVVALTFSAGTGIIFGMFPAIKAARLDPIEALRHE
jgi:putative ABC transport system permease protein